MISQSSMTLSARRIADNVAAVRQRIDDAAQRSGRRATDVTLVAVTKYVDLEQTLAVAEAGCLDLGESRPQDLWRKADSLGLPGIRWHLIGHLQRNKVSRTVPLVSLIHSADSLRLLEALDAAAETPLAVLLEVNTSGDAAKHGFKPQEVEPLWPSLESLRNVQVRGLMGMAGLEGDLDAARRDFTGLRHLRDRLREAWPAQASLEVLSMGMSGDYEVAIEEGATIVRIGSALFDGLGV